MFKYRFASLLILLGLWGGAQPAHGQALAPYTVQLDFETLEQQGLNLAQEAAQLAQFQQYELAIARAQLATQLAPENEEVWALLGSLHLQLGQLDDGIKALQQAKTLDRNNAGVLFALGSAYFRKAQYQLAADYLKAGLRVQPETPGALFDLGNTYYKLNRYDAAIAEYEKAVEQDESFWPATNNIGLVLYEQGQVDDAIEYWQAAATVAEAENATEPRLAIAVAQYVQGQQAEGLEQALAALQLDARYADLEFLEENLWGTKLLQDTATLLATPQIKEFLAGADAAELVPDSPAPTAAPDASDK